jgi:RimJ/RimL family protein N-acetyltransferase
LLPDVLETERLLLRPIAEDDLAFFVELHGDPRVMRYMSRGGRTKTPEDTREWLAGIRRRYEEEGTGAYAIVLEQDGRLVGRSGTSLCEIERTPSTPDALPLAAWGRGSFPEGVEVERFTEVGYVVHPAFQGRGYATEAAARWIRFVLEELGEREVVSLVHPANEPSLRVAAKNGMERFARVRLTGDEFVVLRRY